MRWRNGRRIGAKAAAAWMVYLAAMGMIWVRPAICAVPLIIEVIEPQEEKEQADKARVLLYHTHTWEA